MSKSYTIEELQALPDDDLNVLAAKLRGHSIGTVLYAGKYGDWLLDATGNRIMYKSLWGPAVCRNQSGELLAWAWRTHGILFHIGFAGGASMGYVQYETAFECEIIKGNNARAETVAFCVAMLAMTGRLK